MATEKLVQTSFVNGQYDREVQSKERSDFIGQGLAKALNVVSGEKGELRKRLGTRFLRGLDGATVLVPFRLPDGDDIILACTDGNVKGYRFVNNQLVDFVVPTGVAPVFPDSDWTTSNTQGDYTVATEVSRYEGFNAGGQSQYNYVPNTQCTTYIQIESVNPQLLGRLTVEWDIMFSYLGDSDTYPGYYKGWINPIIQYSDDGVDWFGCITQIVDPYTGVAGQEGHKQDYLTIYFPDPVSLLNSRTKIEIINTSETTAHKYWRVYFRNSINNTSIAKPDESLWLNVSNVTYVSDQTTSFNASDSFFDSDLLKKIKYTQHYTQMVMACENKDPIELNYSAGGIALTSFSGLPAGYSKPTSTQFFQQRLWFGGFDVFPTTVIASKIDDYDNFTESSPLAFDDFLELKCSQLRTQITNILGGQKVLYAFSEDGLSCVDSGSGGMIATNQSIEFNLRNRMPSGSAIPAFKDDIMIYASSDGTKLYAVDYDLITERFQVDDLAKYAKDITFEKINELHYVNDESKMVYGLLESGNMFALNYKKGVYQGFFPFKIQDGYVYDIVQIKVGRNYKLLLVTCRSGSWYIEEMPDKGIYIDTIAPMMTQEDKKWATYDNINNNIALDCWQNVEDTESIEATVSYEESKLNTKTDLSAFIDSQIMLSQLNDREKWVIADIDSADESLYGWSGAMTGWTTSATPVANDPVLDINGNDAGFKVVAYTPDDGYGNETLAIIATSGEGVLPGYTLNRNNGIDRYIYNITVDSQHGAETLFDVLYKPLNRFSTILPSGTELGVVSQGQYLGEFMASFDGVELPKPVFRLTYGALYDAYAFIKIERPYESMKTVRQINLEVQNTMHLSVGTSLDDMQVLEDINDNTHYNLTNMTMNGGYVIVPGDTPEWSKYIIMKSDKGLPFTVNAVEVIINYSNEGGN
jgi:hypothetical protein